MTEVVKQTALALVTPTQTDLALATEASEVALAVARASDMPVSTPEDLADIVEVVQQVKARAKELDVLEKSATKPMNEALSVVRSWYRPIRDQLGTLERALKARLCEGERLANQARQAALQAAQVAVATAAPDARAAILAIPDKPRTAGASVRTIWKYEVVTPIDVPDAYWSVDPALVGAAVSAGARDIPGVRIWSEQSVTIRQK